MMFRRKEKESPLERLEREANDDFRLLDELGPTHFGADHLMEMHAQARERLTIFRGRQRLAMIMGGTATGWVLLAMVANLFGFEWLAFATFGAAALSFGAFLFIVFWQKKRFESRGELEYTKRIIEEELHRRAQLRREANR
ncbi:MAG: VirB3 family type IV secretion system protein [Saprospiraceae bacterium]